jgi:hypothetical protein
MASEHLTNYIRLVDGILLREWVRLSEVTRHRSDAELVRFPARRFLRHGLHRTSNEKTRPDSASV